MGSQSFFTSQKFFEEWGGGGSRLASERFELAKYSCLAKGSQMFIILPWR